MWLVITPAQGRGNTERHIILLQVVTLSSLWATKHGPPEPLQPHYDPLNTIQLWPDIQIKAYSIRSGWVLFPAIEINDVLYFLPTSIDSPVVPIERPLVTQHDHQSCFGAQAGAITSETGEPWPATAICTAGALP